LKKKTSKSIMMKGLTVRPQKLTARRNLQDSGTSENKLTYSRTRKRRILAQTQNEIISSSML